MAIPISLTTNWIVYPHLNLSYNKKFHFLLKQGDYILSWLVNHYKKREKKWLFRLFGDLLRFLALKTCLACASRFHEFQEASQPSSLIHVKVHRSSTSHQSKSYHHKENPTLNKEEKNLILLSFVFSLLSMSW